MGPLRLLNEEKFLDDTHRVLCIKIRSDERSAAQNLSMLCICALRTN